MKNSCQRFFISCVFVFMTVLQIHAQAKIDQTTILLIRHAEKDTSAASATMMQDDPPLSNKGIQRAGKLVETLKAYSIDSIFSTNFNRTQSTVQPIAAKSGIKINIYETKNLPTFAARLSTIKHKTVLVVGHSNTIPALVNLLIGSDKYANMADNEYDKIWILRFENGKFTETQIQY